MRFERLLPFLLLAAAGTAAAAPPATFERIYGSPKADDDAGAMIPVHVCPEGGFLAVATHDAPSGDRLENDPHLIRTRPDGSHLWERRYPAPGSYIATRTIVESAGGFVMAGGRLDRGRNHYDLWLSKVDCDGRPLWTRTYDAAGGSEFARRVIEATTGDPARGTRPGDLIIVGESTVRGMLMRVAADGRAIWQRVYDNQLDPMDVGEILTGVIQARPRNGARTGDVVAAGHRINFINDEGRGYALRVNGDTGDVDPQSDVHGFALFGNETQYVDFNAVVELPSDELVFLGRTAEWYPGASRLFVARTAAAPWLSLDQRTIGSKLPATNIQDAVISKHPIFRKRVLIAGSVGDDAGSVHAFTLALDPLTLAPAAGTGRLYGHNTFGRSLVALESGLALAGAQWNPSHYDAFLVRTDEAGRTGCERDWAPSFAPLHVDVARIAPTVLNGDVATRVRTSEPLTLETVTRACR